jgi:hypothetical protein
MPFSIAIKCRKHMSVFRYLTASGGMILVSDTSFCRTQSPDYKTFLIENRVVADEQLSDPSLDMIAVYLRWTERDSTLQTLARPTLIDIGTTGRSYIQVQFEVQGHWKHVTPLTVVLDCALRWISAVVTKA